MLFYAYFRLSRSSNRIQYFIFQGYFFSKRSFSIIRIGQSIGMLELSYHFKTLQVIPVGMIQQAQQLHNRYQNVCMSILNMDKFLCDSCDNKVHYYKRSNCIIMSQKCESINIILYQAVFNYNFASTLIHLYSDYSVLTFYKC